MQPPVPAAESTATQTNAAGTRPEEVVTLPPYELDAVEPPWARDSRTASTSTILLKDQGDLTLVDALRAWPGVRIEQPGGPGGRSSVYLRGGEENYTIVLLDGVPVNNPTDSRGGGFDLGTLDAPEIATVEVVRGAVSARYGAEALSGVIKLTTDVMAVPEAANVVVAAGGRGLSAAHIAAGTRQKDFTAALSANWSEDGDRGAGNFARHRALATGIGWQGSDVECRMSLRYGQHFGAAFPDDSGGERFAVLRSLEERSGSTATAAVEVLSPGSRGAGIKWRVRTWGAWLRAHDDSPGVAPGLRDPAGLPASLEATTLRRIGVSAEGAADVGKDGTLVVGVDGQTERGKSDSALLFDPFAVPTPFTAVRDRVGAFTEFTWHPARGWLVQPSLRVDKPDNYSWRVTPRLGVRVPIAKDTSFRFNAGTGFKLPSFYAVANPLVGNPSLKPEKSRAVDVGFEHQFARGRGIVELGGFWSRYRDGIDFDPGPPPRLVNRSQIRSDGIEASLRWQAVAAVDVALSGTYADTRSEPGSGPLRGRARTEGAVRIGWRPTSRFRIEASAFAVGRVFDSSVPTGDIFLPDWHRIDVAGRCECGRHLAVTVAIDNLLDTHSQEAIGVPSRSRRFRGAIEARF